MPMKFKTFLCLFFLFSPGLSAQEGFELWTSLGMKGNWKHIDYTSVLEIRNKDFAGQLKRASLQLEASYAIVKPLKIGASYQFINYYDADYDDYQLRQRFSVFASGRSKMGNLSFNLREQLQYTTKDDSDRLKSDGTIDNYAISPEWLWRSKLKAIYNIPHFPVNPALSAETFFQLNNPEGNAFSKIRYTLSFDYHLSRHHQIELSGLINRKINQSAPVSARVIGIGYTYTF
jgi:hypothetical protein